MESEIRVNKINNRAGLGTMTFTDTGIIVSGITTTTDNIRIDADNKKLQIGSNQYLEIYDDGSYRYIQAQGHLFIDATGDINFRNGTTGEYKAAFNNNGPCALNFNGIARIATTNTGINVTGNVVGDGLTIDGNSDLNGDLDVDGHTNLDHVSVAGFTTCSGGLKMINSAKLRFGTNNNTYIYYDAGSGVSHFQLTGGNLSIASNVSNSYEYMIRAHTNGRVELYYDGDEKIRTTDKGILVGTGVTIETNGQANFVGVVTATSSPSANMGLRNVSISTVSPSGGSDGDLWFTYVA